MAATGREIFAVKKAADRFQECQLVKSTLKFRCVPPASESNRRENEDSLLQDWRGTSSSSSRAYSGSYPQAQSLLLQPNLYEGRLDHPFSRYSWVLSLQSYRKRKPNLPSRPDHQKYLSRELPEHPVIRSNLSSCETRKDRLRLHQSGYQQVRRDRLVAIYSSIATQSIFALNALNLYRHG